MNTATQVPAEHVVMFSGGVGSWATARRVANRHGTENLRLLFADTLIEDEDLYRFIEQAARNVGGRFVHIAEGRTPWQVFRDERFLGNRRFDPCSKILKRKMLDDWLSKNCDPANTVVHVGIDWSEEHRYTRLQARRAEAGWRYEAPMCGPPHLTKKQMLQWLQWEGIEPPRLYQMGFSHNNCGGFCIKAGQGHFANLLKHMPERYAFHEEQERRLRSDLKITHTILRQQRNGVARPLSLEDLRKQIEGGAGADKFDIGGCGCAIDDGPDEEQEDEWGGL